MHPHLSLQHVLVADLDSNAVPPCNIPRIPPVDCVPKTSVPWHPLLRAKVPSTDFCAAPVGDGLRGRGRRGAALEAQDEGPRGALYELDGFSVHGLGRRSFGDTREIRKAGSRDGDQFFPGLEGWPSLLPIANICIELFSGFLTTPKHHLNTFWTLLEQPKIFDLGPPRPTPDPLPKTDHFSQHA